MSTAEKMKAYIQRTAIKNADQYAMDFSEIDALYQMSEQGHIFDALLLSFRFGRAKGYRMAKKELRHG